MALLVVGTLAFDDVETPFGRVEKVLGGSATYFSYAASFFTDVRLVVAAVPLDLARHEMRQKRLAAGNRNVPAADAGQVGDLRPDTFEI